MSGTRPTPVEQHLGDRLASFVDGELGHDARDRVLAHLATCPRCKAEADAQRRLKTTFAEAAPPPPSETFLARLQGLPGGGLPGGPGGPGGGFPARDRGPFGSPVFEPAGEGFAHAPALVPDASGPSGQGFRIHPVGRSGTERPPVRGRRRFAFAAAGAVSFAAIALGGVSTVGVPVDGGDARGPSSNNVTPLRGQGTTVPAGDGQRRRAATPMLGQRTGGALAAPVAPAPAAAPLRPGTVAPGTRPLTAVHALAAPLLAGASVTSPLLHPVPPVTVPFPPVLHDRPNAVPPADDPALGVGASADPLPARGERPKPNPSPAWAAVPGTSR
ncbi:anti-sigma factor family protein [Streptomyces sp. JNUCC 64]